MFAFFFYWALLIYMGSGPLWPSDSELMAKCSDKWWTYFLFINNFADTAGANCFGWAWYIAVEF